MWPVGDRLVCQEVHPCAAGRLEDRFGGASRAVVVHVNLDDQAAPGKGLGMRLRLHVSIKEVTYRPPDLADACPAHDSELRIRPSFDPCQPLCQEVSLSELVRCFVAFMGESNNEATPASWTNQLQISQRPCRPGQLNYRHGQYHACIAAAGHVYRLGQLKAAIKIPSDLVVRRLRRVQCQTLEASRSRP